MNGIGKRIFVTGTDTGVGKTLVSAIVTRALGADYWKPVQCGDLDSSDSDTVRRLADDDRLVIHPEAFRLKTPASPHRAASVEGVSIRLDNFRLPVTDNTLVVEGAGGVLVPLNEEERIIDLAAGFGLAAVVVCRHYLGSLNHTFLTVEAIRSRGIALAGLVFSSESDGDYEDFISAQTGLPVLLKIAKEDQVTPRVVASYAEKFKEGIRNGSYQ